MSKELFLKNKELSSKWRDMALSDNFEQVLTFARSEISQQGPSTEMLKGAELMAHTLLTLAEPEEVSFLWPKTGLDHMADKMPTRPAESKRKKK